MTSPVSTRLHLALAAGLAAVTALLFLPSLSGELVSDDVTYVEQNPLVQHPADAWTEPFPNESSRHLGLYRPLTVASYGLDQAVFGLDAAAFHLTQVLLAGVLTALAFCVLAAWTGRPLLSLAAAAAWAAHPTHVEAIAWVSGRSELLAMIGGLAGYLAYLRGRSSSRVFWPIAAALLVTAGAASKENGFTWVGVVVAHEVLFPRGAWGARLRRLVTMILLPLSLWLYRGEVLGRIGPRGESAVFEDVEGVDRLFLQARLLCEGLAKTFWPVGLSVHHPEAPFREAGFGALALAVLFLLLLAFGLARRRLRPAAFGGLVFLATLAPALHLVPTGESFADRFLLAPTFGMALAIAVGACRLDSRGRFGVALVLGAGAIAGSVTSLHQMKFWRTERALWERAAQLHPDEPEVLFGLAYANLTETDEPAAGCEAARLLSRLLREHPNWRPSEVLLNLGFAHERCGDLQLAATYYRLSAQRFDGPMVLRAIERLLNLARAGQVALQRGEGRLLVSRLLTSEPDPARRRQLEQRYRSLMR